MALAKIFYPEHLCNPKFRANIFPLLKPFLKNSEYSDTERQKSYGISSKDISFVKEMKFADVIILPMSWNYYVKTGSEKSALKFISSCSAFRKKIFIYNAGDVGYKIPYFSNALIFRSAVNTGKRKDNELIIPAFINDPLKIIYNSHTIFQRSYNRKPKVGFCGFAKTSNLDATLEVLKIQLQNLRSSFGLRNEEPQQLMSSSYFRGEILKILEDSSKVDANLIVRKNYRAGVKSEKKTHPTVYEFYDNIRESDYVLCVRGAGNFSVRFYETLAMGRIPVYINTHGALPMENQINWKNHVVWVEKSEINYIGKKIEEFHHNIDSNSFQDLLVNNRKLWQEKLTLGSYFKIILVSEIARIGNKK